MAGRSPTPSRSPEARDRAATGPTFGPAPDCPASTQHRPLTHAPCPVTLWGMSDTSTGTATLPDARELLKLLSAADIRAKLQELDSEQRALRVLLRAAIARERGPRGKAVPA